MDNNKSPRNHQWSSGENTVEKTPRRWRTELSRLQRQEVVTQFVRQWNAAEKTGGNEAAPSGSGDRPTTGTPIYSEKFSHQERTCTSSLEQPGDFSFDPSNRRHLDERLFAYPGQGQAFLGDDLIIALFAPNTQQIPAIGVQHIRPKKRKKAPFLQLISYTYVPKIWGILVTNLGAIRDLSPNNVSRIVDQSVGLLGGIFSQSIPNIFSVYSGFETWTRAP